METQNTRARIIPGMRYRNAPAAIEWLCKAFGFEKHLVVPGENGTIAHAQLTFGNGMIMVSSTGGGMFGKLMKLPEDYGGRGYTCRDLEGHIWSFGSYDPWVG